MKDGDSEQAAAIAEVIQRTRPEILLLCEFDHDPFGRALRLFHDLYLRRSQNGQPPLEYRHRFSGPVNTGLPTGCDLNRDGEFGGPADAVGFGRHEGQYGMAVLSMYEINCDHIRTFQRFLWRDMPGALLPKVPNEDRPYYNQAELSVLRLSSKSFWDVPISIVKSDTVMQLHLLCSHPTPPVFDGSEDRNGRRNHDEIRLVADYLDGQRGAYLVDDLGRRGAISEHARFVVAGDLNADPLDGSSTPGAIQQLLDHPRINSTPIPLRADGTAARAKRSERDPTRRTDPAQHTADFGRDGALRVDYVLPSRDLQVIASGVFWPRRGEPGSEAITASDHRLVWIDIAVDHEPPQ